MDYRKSKTSDLHTTQPARFARMAEELECDPDEAAFKAKLAVIAKAKRSVKAPDDGAAS